MTLAEKEMVQKMASAMGIKLPDTEEKNVTIVREGKQIKLPENMTYDEGITWLQRKKEEEEKQVAIRHQIPCSPLDGLVAFHKALASIYGWTNLAPTPGWFGGSPPTMIGVPVGHGKTVQVAWGRVNIPNVWGFLQTEFDWGKTPGFLLTGQTKQKHLPEILKIREKMEEIVRKDSIYQGNAVKISFQWKRDEDDFDPFQHAPQFMDLANINENDLILSKSVQKCLNIGLFLPIKHAAFMRKCQAPLKRGVLMHGKYGVGKSLAAAVTAKLANKHGWTFLYLNSTEDLEMGLQFARQYSPCVLFCEDIDKCLDGERDVDMDALLNLLDGIDNKTQECLVVFTTNHIERINPAAIRMGRLDTVVEITEPDSEAAVRLVKLYGRGLLSPAENYDQIGDVLAGRIPAFIRETVERAKIAAIGRLAEEGRLNDSTTLENEVLGRDILDAAKEMEPHVAMLSRNTNPKKTKVALLAHIPENTPYSSKVLKELGVAANGEMLDE